ncbi:YceI family protein [Azohydromonas lata]|uniref:YceI family protein n=1 Tax=Azohydromonas lata TaxID=45677 RepID=A0ABU5INQ3_9BURK|nr:YceI family protein [Azohydromonas lata]MDZ5460502.1 YceI family protein [Azohydromonas lata]
MTPRTLSLLALAAALAAPAAWAQSPAKPAANAATAAKPAPAAAAPAPAQLVAAQSEVTFTSRQMGVPVDGRFRRFDAQVQFDPKKPETARIALKVDLASISMGAPESEAEVVKPEWFNTAKFPQATFTSTAVKALGGGRFDVAGQFALKGVTRDIVVPVTLAAAGANTVATGGFTLKRLDHRIGEGEWSDTSMVANDVAVKFKLTFSGIPAQ